MRVEFFIFLEVSPSNELKTNRLFGVEPGSAFYLLHAGFFLDLFFNHEDGVTSSSETSVDFQRAARRYIPEGRILYHHSCENPK
jgi:hypothetical protein